MDFLRRGNRELIKDLNRALVIDQLRKKGPLSRTDVAQQTKLGLSTVTKIVDSLMEQNLVREVGQGDSCGGRKPIFIDLNYDYGYCIGIRVVKRGLKLAVTNLRPAIQQRLEIPFPDNASSEYVLPLLIEAVKKVIAEKRTTGTCLGIGIGISGLVDIEHGKLICSKLLGWEQIEFRALLEDNFDVPVFVDNDVNVYTLAELSYGQGRYANNFAVIALGVGLGAGLVLDGKLYRGEFGGAGEIGHTLLYPDGKRCYCGQKGCLENYVADAFIIEETKKMLAENYHSMLYINRDSLQTEHIFYAARNGDEVARQVLARVGRNLGLGLLNLINTLNPKTIILTGEHLPVAQYILPFMREVIDNSYFPQYHSAIDIRVSELGEEAWEIGAVTMVLNELFRAPIYRDQKGMILV